MGAAQRTRQFGRRGKAVAQGHDVGLDAEIRCLDAADAIIAQQPCHTAAPVQDVAQPGGEREALQQQKRVGPGRSRQSRPAAEARTGCGFEHRHDIGAALAQLRRRLQAERAVAGDDDAPARRHAIGARQRLQAADGHDSRQGPARHMHRLLVGAGRQHQPLGPEQGRAAGDDRRDLGRREGRPYRRLVQDPDARAHGRLEQHGAVAELPVEVRHLGRLRGRQRLEVLAAGMQPLVGHDHVGARQRQAARRRQTSRTRADDQDIAGDLLGRRRRFRRPRGRHRRGTDIQAGLDLGQAGPLVGAAIDRHQAIEADAHAAKRPARGARTRPTNGDDIGRGQRGSDGLAGQRLDLGAVEPEANRGARRPRIGVLQAHGKRFTMAPRGTT